MRNYRYMTILTVVVTVGIQASLAYGEKIELPLAQGLVVEKTDQLLLQRGFMSVPLPGFLDSVHLDVAELVVTVSAANDSTQPPLVAAFPSTVALADRSTTWSDDWTSMTGGFTTEIGGLATMVNAQKGREISVDITGIVRLWLDRRLPNNGLVLKSLAEEKSTFGWVRDSRYDGADAKLVIHYSRLNR